MVVGARHGNNVCPFINHISTITNIITDSGRQHPSRRRNAKHERSAARHCNHVLPALDLMYVFLGISAKQHSTVRTQSDCKLISARNCNNIVPVGYVALSVIILTTGKNVPVLAKSQCKFISASHKNYVFPRRNVALPLLVITGSQHPSRRRNTYLMRIPTSDINDILPLIEVIISCNLFVRNNRSRMGQSDHIIMSARESHNTAPFIRIIFIFLP